MTKTDAPRRKLEARRRGAGGRFASTAATDGNAATPGAADAPTAAPGATSAIKDTGAPLRLFFIRHADAGDSTTWKRDDAKRPLSKQGRRQSKRLGDRLAALKVSFDTMLTSPKVRAAQTAKIVGKSVGVKPKVDARLGGGFDGAGLQQLIDGLPAAAGAVAVVGHDPDFSAVVSWLTGAPISLPKGALARVDLADRSAGADLGLLRWLLPPDAISR
jgi:phosphohistidine phosphatase